MKEKCHLQMIEYHRVREILNRRFGKHEIPKKLHYVFLKEMEEFGLIKKIGNTSSLRFQLVAGNIDNSINQYLSFI